MPDVKTSSPATATTDPMSLPWRSASPPKILLVEDDPVSSQTMQSLLLRKGFTVVGVCVSGEEALDAARRSDIDLVLMDIELEGDLDGVETAQAITRSLQLPVVYVTAYYDNERTIARAASSESYGLITKPVSVAQLESTIYMALYKHKLENQLLQARKMEAIGVLAGGIAHDFNNLLASISGYAQLIKLKSDRREYVHRNVDLILQTTERGKGLVEHILTFSRQKPQEKSVFPLHLIVKESLNILERTLPESIAVERDIIARDDFVQADPSQMHELCMNLYSNAVQAMQEQGGSLRVTLSRLEGCTQALPVGSSSCLYLAVEDTGVGMNEDTLNRIFEPFFTTRSPHGSGLGLSVVHGIVTEVGGTVRVQSKPAEGTRFEVYLPAAAPAEASRPTDEGTTT